MDQFLLDCLADYISVIKNSDGLIGFQDILVDLYID